MEFHGNSCPNPPWNSMENFPWISMEFHGGISHGEGRSSESANFTERKKITVNAS